MNIYQLPNKDVFRFELYNLNYFKECPHTEISGHYTFWYHKPSGKFVYCKHGDYCNLVSIRPVKEMPREIEEHNREPLAELLNDAIKHAYFWNYDAPHNHMGRYLLDELEAACEKDEHGWGRESFKHAHDEFYDIVMKRNCIFECDYPGKDYRLDAAEWRHTKKMDRAATKLLTA